MAKVLRAAATALVVLVPYACGGTSKHTESDTGTGAVGGSTNDTGGTGGSTGGKGGRGGTGGKGGSAGMAAAGTGADGGSFSTGGIGGAGFGGDIAGRAGTAGNPASDRCIFAAPMLVACDGGTWFYHDALTGECVGVGPNQCSADSGTGFSSLADCLATCPGSKPAITACDHAWDCTVVDLGCCGACEPVATDQVKAANATRTGDAIGCTNPVTCGACPNVDELDRTRQNFIAECVVGNCRLSDLRETIYTSCTKDQDCFLREGAGCCTGCGGQDNVALSSTEFLANACEAPTPCPACAPPPRTDIEAYCEVGVGRCSIRYAEGGAAGAAGAAP